MCVKSIHLLLWFDIIHATDIEDKGTSGETFLAACEYLEQEQPAVALFENVDKAPWGKMQEYIEGRLTLGDRNSIKNITEIKKGGKCRFFVMFDPNTICVFISLFPSYEFVTDAVS